MAETPLHGTDATVPVIEQVVAFAAFQAIVKVPAVAVAVAVSDVISVSAQTAAVHEHAPASEPPTPHAQSVVPLHPHTPETHAVPFALPAQLAWQVPPVAAEQQPPLQACDELHEVVQACVARSQAKSAGQSVVALHPQVPLPEVTLHTAPASAVTQFVHVPPAAPHAVGDSGFAHVEPLQHVPLHTWLPEQDDSQA